MQWYVINITSGFEQKIKNTIESMELLRSKDKRVLIPAVKRKRFNKDRLIHVSEKLYPGYVFVACALEDYDAIFGAIADIPGILNMSSIKGIRRIERRIYDEEMLGVFNHISDTKDNVYDLNHSQIEVDSRIKIVEGPFSSFQGVVMDINKATNKETKLKICTSLFGNEVSTVVIPLSHVELL